MKKDNGTLLGVLAEFLNLDLSKLDIAHVKAPVSVAELRLAPGGRPSLTLCLILRRDVDRRGAKQHLVVLQSELKNDLLAMMDTAKDLYDALNPLVHKIEAMNLLTGRSLMPARDASTPSAFRVLIERRKEKVELIETRRDRSAREAFYRILDGALRSKHFFYLKACRQCGCFFMASHLAQGYCSKQCAYKKRLPYYAKKMKAWRAKRKKQRKTQKQKTPAAPSLADYFARLLKAEKTDRPGTLLPIYKRLGGPQLGRRFIQNLRDKSWDRLDVQTQRKIATLADDYPLPG